MAFNQVCFVFWKLGYFFGRERVRHIWCGMPPGKRARFHTKYICGQISTRWSLFSYSYFLNVKLVTWLTKCCGENCLVWLSTVNTPSETVSGLQCQITVLPSTCVTYPVASRHSYLFWDSKEVPLLGGFVWQLAYTTRFHLASTPCRIKHATSRSEVNERRELAS